MGSLACRNAVPRRSREYRARAAGVLTVMWLHRDAEQSRAAESAQNEAREPD
jgi:hypothetical protein